MLRHMRLVTLVLLCVAGAVLSIAVMPAVTASAASTDDQVHATLQKLYAAVPVAKTIGEKARAVLVFPNVVKAGFIVGAQYGDGVLFKGGKSAGDYNTIAGSVGYQAGAEKFGYALFLMNDAALKYLDDSAGWELGAGPEIVIIDQGAAARSRRRPPGRMSTPSSSTRRG